MERGETGVRIGAKVSVFGDEVGEKNVVAITNETWLTGGKEKVEEEKRRTRKR